MGSTGSAFVASQLVYSEAYFCSFQLIPFSLIPLSTYLLLPSILSHTPCQPVKKAWTQVVLPLMPAKAPLRRKGMGERTCLKADNLYDPLLCESLTANFHA